MHFLFYKYHGLGNDYIVIDPNINNIHSLKNADIIKICNRNKGVGADGVILGPFLKDDKFHCELFNSDGSKIGKSGNAIRIFAKYLSDFGYTKKTSFSIFIPLGEIDIEIIDIKEGIIKMNMGNVQFDSVKIPVSIDQDMILDYNISLFNRNFNLNCCNIGDPHCVILENDLINPELSKKYGPLLENHPIFPNRINVHFINILNRKNIKIEIWERGAGYTLSSGTSSSCAFITMYKRGLVDSKISVICQGGTFDIELMNNNIFLSGKIDFICSGNLNIAD